MQPCLPEPTWNRGSIVDQMWPMSKAFGCRLWIFNSNLSLFLWSTFCRSDEVLEPSFCYLVSVKRRYQILKPVDSKESKHSGGRPSNPDQMQKAWSMITVKTEHHVWQQNRSFWYKVESLETLWTPGLGMMMTLKTNHREKSGPCFQFHCLGLKKETSCILV